MFASNNPSQIQLASANIVQGARPQTQEALESFSRSTKDAGSSKAAANLVVNSNASSVAGFCDVGVSSLQREGQGK
jgi:hypothetical protein